HAGYRAYEELIAAASDRPPTVTVTPEDPWTLMYTSGTTGKPKGAIRSHGGSAMLSLVTDVELGFSSRDSGLLVMPMCHANSLFFFGAFSYCGAACTVYNRKSFDPEHLVRTLADGHATFTSLVPTHYIMMLGLSPDIRAKHDVSAVTKLMVSSAPARRDTKLEIMDYFKNTGLFELYGSTEAGWVTMLHPDEQFTKLGSVGRECVGSRPIRILDADGNDVRDGEPGELYSCNSYTFDGYWKLPDKTRDAFRGDYCTVGDLARRDEEGYIHLVDRKSNMIISGGENVYPSEVESLVGGHPKVKDVAVIGIFHCRRRNATDRDRKNFAPHPAYEIYANRSKFMSKPAVQSQDLNADQQSCAAWIARFLKARGIDRIFGLQGGHIQPIWDHVARQGIRIIDVRDEGAAVHMAHAHAELTGQFGVAMVTAGPGVTNTVTAIANASLARIPVLLIGGCTSRPQANMGPLQDIPHVDILRPVTRTSRTARVPEQVVRELDEAVARAMGDNGEPGPVYLEVPTDVL